MSLEELQPHELMQKVAGFFESLMISYRVVGSMASMAYGEPRLTIDIDMVADLKIHHVVSLCANFTRPDYYLSESAVLMNSQFNLIHIASGLKVDVFIPKRSEFNQSAASRIRRLRSEGEFDVWFGSPEDVLLNKLIYFQIGGGVSDKHLRDISGMMKLLREKLDRDYVSRWAARLGVSDEWIQIQQRVDADSA